DVLPPVPTAVIAKICDVLRMTPTASSEVNTTATALSLPLIPGRFTGEVRAGAAAPNIIHARNAGAGKRRTASKALTTIVVTTVPARAIRKSTASDPASSFHFR